MRRAIFAAFVLLATGATSASAQNQAVVPGDGVEQKIRPGDVLRLKVWREPDLSGEIDVNADGTAVIPRLGPVQVAGYSGPDLRRLIETQLGEVLRDPTVDVTVLRRVRVLGAVVSPGLYALEPTMTIADAVAKAGGPNNAGRRDRVELIRKGELVEIELAPDAPLAALPIYSGDELRVPERSWFVRNFPVLITTGTAAAGLIVAYLVSQN